MRRRSWPSGGAGLGGLTMSEEGGLDEVEKSGRGELHRNTSDGAREHLQPRLLGVQLRVQTPTVRARLPCRALGLMVGYATSLAGNTQHR